jgi:hypothetical protein
MNHLDTCTRSLLVLAFCNKQAIKWEIPTNDDNRNVTERQYNDPLLHCCTKKDLFYNIGK